MSRRISFAQAILEATDQCLADDPSVYLMGLGASDPKGIFGTTLGLVQKYGPERVLDMPTAENGMTGIAIGSAITGLRPIMTHQRVDFVLLLFDQLINNAAKWHYMFAGKMKVPLVLRLMVGRGWGQGPQHSQSLQSLFAHIPGLKVVMPALPYDAKGLLISAVKDDNPVVFLEHRWLHGISGKVPESMYEVRIGEARVLREGCDVTFVSSSYMTLEALRGAEILSQEGIEAEVLDLRSLRPLDEEAVIHSVRKTGRVVAIDGAWRAFGTSAEILALVTERAFGSLKCAPQRLAFPDAPTPTSWRLANHFYPGVPELVSLTKKMFGISSRGEEGLEPLRDRPLDVPDPSFCGPF